MPDLTHFRRCLKFPADRSPNVRLALAEQRAGKKPSGRTLVPGVVSWAGYRERRSTLTPDRQCVVLDADWWEGAEQRLTPDDWLKRAVEFAAGLIERAATGRFKRDLPRHLGIDSGEGADDSAWCVGDRLGVLDLISLKTPDTNQVFGRTLDVMRKWNVPPEHMVFDLGGGGREHAHRLRAAGFPVRGVGFGKAPSMDVKRAGIISPFEERRDVREDAAAYPDRRSEMAYDVRLILERDAAGGYLGKNFPPGEAPADGFGLPDGMCDELIRQLGAVPLDWDDKGRFKLIPKNPPPRSGVDSSKVDCFRNRIGRSPDQFDALCLMVFSMTHKPTRLRAGGGA